jgi:hypothetical protein
MGTIISVWYQNSFGVLLIKSAYEDMNVCKGIFLPSEC